MIPHMRPKDCPIPENACPARHPVRHRSRLSVAHPPPFVVRLFLRQPDAFALRIRETPPVAVDFGETARIPFMHAACTRIGTVYLSGELRHADFAMPPA